MIVSEFEYIDRDPGDDLLDNLRETVFHLTTRVAFDQIRQDGLVYQNKDGRFALNPTSETSFGRLKGWVCLFDLRNRSQDVIDDTLQMYYFLRPSWFVLYDPDYAQADLAYLILDRDAYKKIIPNETARREWSNTGKYRHYVPQTECWFPGNLPIKYIERVLLIRVHKSVSKDNEFYYAHHMLAVEQQRKRRDG
jgi:hypothetical protein